MAHASWFTRLGPLSGLLGAILTVGGMFFPLIVTGPNPNARFADPYPPTINGIEMLRSLASESRISLEVSVYIPMVIVLALLTLATSGALLLRQGNMPQVVSWIRTLASIGALIVLLWFINGVERLNFVEAGLSPAEFNLGLGAVIMAIGIVLSALGLGRVGLGAIIGAGLGYLPSASIFGIVFVFIAPFPCLLGALIGWLIQRASSKGARIASS